MAYYILKSYKLKVDPFDIFRILNEEKNSFFLDSVLNSKQEGRYSFLGIDPFYTLKAKGELPFRRLKEELNKYKISVRPGAPPFLGGAVGYLAYDLGFLLEKKLKKANEDDLMIPDYFFGFFNAAVIIDNKKKIIYLFASGIPEKRQNLAKSLAEANFKKLYNLVCLAAKSKASPKVSGLAARNYQGELKSNFCLRDYLAAIEKAKDYIRAGDIYQINLSQRFEAKTNFTGFDIYERLRKISPSNFSAYLDAGGFEIISSSPERFLSLEGKRVLTRPMKGTRPRGKTAKEDSCLRNNLLKSAKDRAELMMILDLERNDLGKVCDYDSIKVPELRRLEKYATVYQTTSTVEGRLFKGKDRFDLLRACFPGGSITGCPKVRAMEIIEELEPARRSIYTGALGYLSFSGNMDFNILIRTLLKKKDKLYFGVGGGIVADSDPQAEYEETLVKARAMISAITPRTVSLSNRRSVPTVIR